MSGILIRLGNPKSVLFYVSIFPTVIDVSTVGMADTLLLTAVTGVILLIAQYPFALAGARARHALNSPRAVKLMNRGGAVCMSGVATAIATRQ
ncbi:LysE family translocator [Agrobacterium leguminum]|uniref:LysE family translocator n=1 Tax=Agrobacterium leguminum TaxID=2792015 RepID=UPI0022A6F9AD|nr:LysE family transporter [Agrobacterium leguminum]